MPTRMNFVRKLLSERLRPNVYWCIDGMKNKISLLKNFFTYKQAEVLPLPTVTWTDLTTSNLRARAAHYVFSRTHRLRSRSFANWASPQNDAADLSLPVRTMLAATEDLSRVIRGRANFWCWLENSKMLGSVIFGPMIFR